MLEFSARRTSRGSRRSFWILAGMGFLLPLILWGALHLRLDVRPGPHAPPEGLPARAHAWFKHQFGIADSIVLAWEGSSLSDPRLDQFVRRIRGEASEPAHGGLRQVHRVLDPRDLLAQMQAQGVDAETAESRLQGIWLGPGAWRLDLTPAGRAAGPQAAKWVCARLLERFGIQAFATQDSAAQWDLADPLATSTGACDLEIVCPGLRRDAPLAREVEAFLLELELPLTSRQKVAERLVEAVNFGPATPIALGLELSESGRADPGQTVSELRKIASQCGIPASALHMAGGPVSGLAAREAVVKLLWNPDHPLSAPFRRAPLACALVACLLITWYVLGDPRLTLAAGACGLWTLALSACGMALLDIPVTPLNVTAPLGIALLTLLACVRLHATRPSANSPATTAPGVESAFPLARLFNTLSEGGPHVWALLASLAAISGWFGSGLPEVHQFALCCLVGSVGALTIVAWGFPALRNVLDIRFASPEPDTESNGWRTYAHTLVPRRRLVGALWLIVAGIAAWGSLRAPARPPMVSQLEAKANLLRDQSYFDQRLAGNTPLDLVVRFDQAAQSDVRFADRVGMIREIESELRALPRVTGTLSFADRVPALGPPPTETASKRERAAYSLQSSDLEEQVRAWPTDVKCAWLTVAHTGSQFNAPGDELWRISACARLGKPAEYEELAATVDRVCQAVLRHTSGQSTEKYRGPREEVCFHPGASHLLTGTVPVFLAQQEQFRVSLLQALISGVAAASLVLVLALRHPLAGVLVLAPGAVPAACTLGLCRWLGIPLDTDAVIALPAILALSLPGPLYLVDRFRRAMHDAASPAAAVIDSLQQVGPALWQTGLLSVGCCGGVALLIGPAPSSLGCVLAGAAGLMLVADLSLLPTLLAGPYRHLFKPAGRRRGVAPVSAQASISPGHAGLGGPHAEGSMRRILAREADLGSPNSSPTI